MRRNISGYSGGAESAVTAALSGSGMRMPGGGRGRGWRGTRPGMSSERCRRGAKLLHAAGTGGRGVPQRVPGRAGQVSVSGLPAAAGVDPAPLCLCCCSVLVCRPAAPGGAGFAAGAFWSFCFSRVSLFAIPVSRLLYLSSSLQYIFFMLQYLFPCCNTSLLQYFFFSLHAYFLPACRTFISQPASSVSLPVVPLPQQAPGLPGAGVRKGSADCTGAVQSGRVREQPVNLRARPLPRPGLPAAFALLPGSAGNF